MSGSPPLHNLERKTRTRRQVATLRRRPLRAGATLAFLTLTLAGCTLRLASDYDEQIDRTATELQQDMDAFLTELGAAGSAEAAGYERHVAFYRGYAVKVRSVRVRAQAHPKNDITLQQLDLMLSSLESLRSTHEEGGTPSAAFLAQTRDLFNTAWGAVIEWELAKKRDAASGATP